VVSGRSDLVEVFYVAEKFWLIVRLAGALLFWSSSVVLRSGVACLSSTKFWKTGLVWLIGSVNQSWADVRLAGSVKQLAQQDCSLCRIA
jgi:hypothetical protein